MQKIGILLFTIFIICSCSTYYNSGNSIQPNVSFVAPANIEIDIEIDTTKLLTGSSTTEVFLGIFKSSDNYFSDAFGNGVGDKEKKAATYKALIGTGNDLIVNPKYVVEYYKGLFIKRTSCKVVGYGGKYIFKTSNITVPDFTITEENRKTTDLKSNYISAIQIGHIIYFENFIGVLIESEVMKITKNSVELKYLNNGEEKIKLINYNNHDLYYLENGKHKKFKN